MTLSIMTLITMTLSMKGLFAIFSIMTLSLTTFFSYAEYAECGILYIVMPNVIRLSVIIPSVVMPNVIMLSFVHGRSVVIPTRVRVNLKTADIHFPSRYIDYV